MWVPGRSCGEIASGSSYDRTRPLDLKARLAGDAGRRWRVHARGVAHRAGTHPTPASIWPTWSRTVKASKETEKSKKKKIGVHVAAGVEGVLRYMTEQ